MQVRVQNVGISPKLGLAIVALCITHCSRRTAAPTANVSQAPAVTVPPVAERAAGGGSPSVSAAGTAVSPVSAQQAGSQTDVPARGPRAEVSGEHYVLTAALSPPSSVPGATSLTVEVRGANGYHVNELYPVGLTLRGSNATAPAQLRRADAREVSQERAAFSVPVNVTGVGAALQGTARFAVCSAQNCIPYERSFAVNLP